ncbi:MAG: J domain-containing protein, partial [Gammaproteobacteria bacterium]|nr:J domain-containing protein [Gammaproteobacteria bacterium]
GQGGKGQGGASDGDLFLEIDLLAHDLYAVDGKNLTLILPVTPWEAALGSSLEVSTLSGKVRLTIPSNSQSGKKFRLRGKGLGSDPSGDLYVVLKIVNPPVVTDQEKQSFDRLAELFDFNPRAEKVI